MNDHPPPITTPLRACQMQAHEGGDDSESQISQRSQRLQRRQHKRLLSPVLLAPQQQQQQQPLAQLQEEEEEEELQQQQLAQLQDEEVQHQEEHESSEVVDEVQQLAELRPGQQKDSRCQQQQQQQQQPPLQQQRDEPEPVQDEASLHEELMEESTDGQASEQADSPEGSRDVQQCAMQQARQLHCQTEQQGAGWSERGKQKRGRGQPPVWHSQHGEELLLQGGVSSHVEGPISQEGGVKRQRALSTAGGSISSDGVECVSRPNSGDVRPASKVKQERLKGLQLRYERESSQEGLAQQKQRRQF